MILRLENMLTFWLRSFIIDLIILAYKDGQSSVHYASRILPEQNHFIGEDAAIVSTLVDAGGDCEKQSFNVSILLIDLGLSYFIVILLESWDTYAFMF